MKLLVCFVVFSLFTLTIADDVKDVFLSTNAVSTSETTVTVAPTTSSNVTTGSSSKSTVTVAPTTSPDVTTGSSSKSTATVAPTTSSYVTTSPQPSTSSLSTSTSSTPTRFTATTTQPIRTTLPNTDPTFHISDGADVCLLLQGEMMLSVTYLDTKNTSKSKLFQITSSANYNGNCSPNEINITISSSIDVHFTLTFTKLPNKVLLSQFKSTVVLSPKLFPDARIPNEVISVQTKVDSKYETPLNKGYYCAHNITIGSNTITLDILKFQFEAFRQSNSTTFDKETTTCDIGASPKVAIIVGIILAVFLIIVIVLFVFFQIRARRRQGYQEI